MFVLIIGQTWFPYLPNIIFDESHTCFLYP